MRPNYSVLDDDFDSYVQREWLVDSLVDKIERWMAAHPEEFGTG